MTSARVEHVLGEIADLSEVEQGELLHDLPRVLHRKASTERLTSDAVRRAIQGRESIRRRLNGAGASAGSVNEDLDEAREGRLADIAGEDAAQDQPQ